MYSFFNEQELRKTIHLLKPDGELFEIRFIGNSGKLNFSGYFTDTDILIERMKNLSTTEQGNFYITLNKINSACYSRQQKDIFVKNCKITTSDNDIDKYEWLLLDFDPKRPSGISSSQDQLEYAHQSALKVYAYLKEYGFPEPIVSLSGNGYHLLYRVELAKTPDNIKLIENTLKSLDMLFSNEYVDVDTTVYNPARICKLYGTVAAKGVSTQERPHRLAYILKEPSELSPIPQDLLQRLVNENIPSELPKQEYKGNKSAFNLTDWIQEHHISITQTASFKSGGTKYILENCPFDENHKGKDACLIQFPNGAICFKCLHQSCSNHTWKDFRLLYEPDAYTKENNNQKRKNSKSKPDSPFDDDGTGEMTIHNLENYLKIKNITVRYNEILHRTEIKGFIGENQEQILENAPALIENELRFLLNGCTQQRISSFLNVISSRNNYNPILEKITSTKWDGKDRLKEVFDIFKISEEDTLSRTIFKKWLMMCICGLHNDMNHPFSLDIVLVLKGKQGAGKTRFFEALALNSLFFGDGVIIDTRNKDDIYQSTSKWICELGEISSTLKRDIDSIKAFLTRSIDEYRLPYGRTSIQYPRMTAFCGTVNDEKFLLDQTGNRRFAVIPLDDDFYIDYEDIRNFNFLQFWTQINGIVQEKIKEGSTYSSCFRLNRPELEEMDKRNREHTKYLPAQQEIEDILSLETTKSYTINYEYQTITEFKQNWDRELHSYKAEQIGKVFESLGIKYERKRVNGMVQKLRKLPVRTWKSLSEIFTSSIE